MARWRRLISRRHLVNGVLATGDAGRPCRNRHESVRDDDGVREQIEVRMSRTKLAARSTTREKRNLSLRSAACAGCVACCVHVPLSLRRRPHAHVLPTNDDDERQYD